MQTLLRLCFLLVVFAVFTPLLAEEEQSDKRAELKSLIPEAIRILKAKEHLTFLKTFILPADLKDLDEDALEALAKQFGERKAPRLIKILDTIKHQKPVLDETGTRATFTFKEEIEGKKSITFIKVEKLWYIKN